MDKINLDTNASFGLAAHVRDVLQRELKSYLNPSSIHSEGQRSRAVIEHARMSISRLLGVTQKQRVIFTSGATEANNAIVFSSCYYSNADLFESDEYAIVTSSVEHPSILAPVRRMQAEGFPVKIVEPREDGNFDPADFFNVCGPKTRLLSVMLANNETGQILPVREIAQLVKERYPQILIHSDGVQSVGKVPVDINELGIDALTITAHKIGGLTGVGALIADRECHIEPLLLGGAQELKFRAGTENVFGILSFGVAADIGRQRIADGASVMKANADFLWSEISRRISGATLNNGHLERLPNTLNVRFTGTRADDLVVALDLEGVLVSAAAACSSGKPEPSHVLLALGLTPEESRSSLRISLHDEYQPGELDRAIEIFKCCVERMRKSRGL